MSAPSASPGAQDTPMASTIKQPAEPLEIPIHEALARFARARLKSGRAKGKGRAQGCHRREQARIAAKGDRRSANGSANASPATPSEIRRAIPAATGRDVRRQRRPAGGRGRAIGRRGRDSPASVLEAGVRSLPFAPEAPPSRPNPAPQGDDWQPPTNAHPHYVGVYTGRLAGEEEVEIAAPDRRPFGRRGQKPAEVLPLSSKLRRGR